MRLRSSSSWLNGAPHPGGCNGMRKSSVEISSGRGLKSTEDLPWTLI